MKRLLLPVAEADRDITVSEMIQRNRTGLAGQPTFVHPFATVEERDHVRHSTPLPEGGIPREGFEDPVRPARPKQIGRILRDFSQRRRGIMAVTAIPPGTFLKPTEPDLGALDKLGP